MRLPRDVYALQSGLVINAFGNGAANPFLVLYLHNVRGISLALAGLAGATSSACSVLGAALSGSLADRRGVKPVMIAGLFVSAIGWLLYPFVREAWQAIALATFTGTGIGSWLTMQSTALALIVPSNLRHIAFAQQRVAANLGLGFGGFAGGLLVTTSDPETFSTLFLLNGATFLLYVLFVARLSLPRPEDRPIPGGYREVLRDRTFVRLLLLHLLFVISAIALLNGLFPVFAKNQAGVTEDAIGLFFLLNSSVIILAQLPIARAVEGHRRARCLALMCVFYALFSLLVQLGGLVPSGAFLFLAAGVMVLSLGECLYDAIYGPLVADLAPEGKTGRYMAASGLSWTVGFTLTPALGGLLLGAEPFALWPVAGGLALAAGLYALRFERFLEPEWRYTPRRVRAPRLRPAAARRGG